MFKLELSGDICPIFWFEVIDLIAGQASKTLTFKGFVAHIGEQPLDVFHFLSDHVSDSHIDSMRSVSWKAVHTYLHHSRKQ